MQEEEVVEQLNLLLDLLTSYQVVPRILFFSDILEFFLFFCCCCCSTHEFGTVLTTYSYCVSGMKKA